MLHGHIMKQIRKMPPPLSFLDEMGKNKAESSLRTLGEYHITHFFGIHLSMLRVHAVTLWPVRCMNARLKVL